MSPAAAQPKLRTPQQLYEDWERSHWSAREVDLARDGEDWARMEDGERTLLHWVLSSLMVAEERISTQFCGLVLAQDDEEEGSFLSTQLVDEVRHMQFYARFQNEVVADPDAIAGHVERARQVLGEPFKKVFDEALVEAHDRLRLDPRNRAGEGRIRDDLPHGDRGHARHHRLPLPAGLPARARPAPGLRGRLRPHRRRRAAPHRIRHPVPPAGGGSGSADGGGRARAAGRPASGGRGVRLAAERGRLGRARGRGRRTRAVWAQRAQQAARRDRRVTGRG